MWMRTLSALLIATVVSCAAAAERIIYVNHAATGANDGSSWKDAFSDLHDALAAAAGAGGEDVQLWVAAGEYLPGPADEDPQSSFQLVSGVAMYGGFAGWETRLDQRDWKNNETVLRREFPKPSVDVAAPLLVGNQLSAGSRIDGLIIRDGYNWPSGGPAGLLLEESVFSIESCSFINNRTIDLWGGAIAANNSTLTVTDSMFIENVT